MTRLVSCLLQRSQLDDGFSEPISNKVRVHVLNTVYFTFNYDLPTDVIIIIKLATSAFGIEPIRRASLSLFLVRSS